MPQTNITHPVTFHISEVKWVGEYALRLKDQYDGLIKDVIVYNHSDPGIPDQEFRIQVLIKDGDDKTKDAIKGVGYDLDLSGDYFVAPTIRVDTISDWESGKGSGSSYYDSVKNTGISVLS